MTRLERLGNKVMRRRVGVEEITSDTAVQNVTKSIGYVERMSQKRLITGSKHLYVV